MPAWYLLLIVSMPANSGQFPMPLGTHVSGPFPSKEYCNKDASVLATTFDDWGVNMVGIALNCIVK
jgi:hypothetical protein